MRHTRVVQLPPRLEALVTKSGLNLAALPEPERDLVLALAACAIEPDRAWREDEANRHLEAWLGDIGSMLRTDHVELRRWLVDTRFVQRDDWGRAYRRGPAERERARALLGSIDAAALFAAVRAVRVSAQHARWVRRQAYEARRAP